MNFFRRIMRWFQHQGQVIAQSSNVILNDKLEQARRAQYGEQYDDALLLLAEALTIVEAHHNATVIVDIRLSRADILIAREEFDAAISALNELREVSESRQQRAPLAYTLASLGIIEQKQGHIDAARAYFEKARDTAEIIHTDGAAGRAIAHLADTYLVEGNASYALYLLQDAIPRLTQSGDKELLGYFLGRLGDALIATAQPYEELAAIQSGLEIALALKYQAQVRELSQKLGIYALQLADYEKAIQYLQDALKLYDKNTLSADYGLLLCHLSRAFYNLGKSRESLDYAHQANEHAEKINQPKLVAMVTAALGLSLSATDQNEEALPLLQAAEQAYAELEADAFYMDILRNLALSQSKAGDIESANATFEKAIEKGRALPLQVAQVYTDRARLALEQGDYKTALQYHADAIRYYTDSNQRNSIARSYCAIGTIYMHLGDGKMALREYEQALIQLNNMSDATTRGYVLALVANAYTEFGDMESAEAFYKEAIEIAKRDNAKLDEATRRGDYGRFLALTYKPKHAITEIMQARNRFEELGLTIERGMQSGNLGLAYAILDDHAKALQYYETGLNYLGNNPHTIIIRAIRGDSFTALLELDDARTDYETALRTAREIGNWIVVVQSLLGLASLDLEIRQLDNAQQYLTEAETIIRHANLKRLQARLFTIQSQLYVLQGENIKAQSAWAEASKLRSMLRLPELTPDWL